MALSNTTLGALMATLNMSNVLIALPAIFRGIRLDPLDPGNTSYLLWLDPRLHGRDRRTAGQPRPAR